MSQPCIQRFTLHNTRGQSVLDSELSSWMTKGEGFEVFGPVIAYSWKFTDQQLKFDDPQSRLSLHVLPDGQGFISFESKRREPDNCVLLDAYGKERLRLTVPVHLTGSENPASTHSPTAFINLSEPYPNPADGKKGEFGVSVWIEHAGKYYCELDYHTGKFLWCRAIRD